MLVSHAQTDELGRIYIARLVHFRIPPGQVVLALKSNYLVMVRLLTGERVQQRVVKVSMPHHHWVQYRRPCRTPSMDGLVVAVDLVWEDAND
jgi:hypothetical protein